MARRIFWRRWLATFNKAQLFRQLTALWFMVRHSVAPRAPKLVALLLVIFVWLAVGGALLAWLVLWLEKGTA